ncbi:LIM domain only protein 3 [Sarcoptes scabiei]|uniref:LIM domain only protein 3 n=1 Tax=Sarcoptes scabiei TaxID=52283 RepID=A0A834R8A5_SARSC|nr:LIM domain only protein 3 [Sarcoptes scabiei]
MARMASNKQQKQSSQRSNNNNNKNLNNHHHHQQQQQHNRLINHQTILNSSSGSSSSSSSLSSSASSSSNVPIECFNCNKPIRERFLLKALDKFWHEDCLKCSCCDCRLGEVGSTLFTKANLILCKRDYLRLFGNTGLCSACNKSIPGFEMVMRAKTNVYHLECFSCFQCHQKFCIGDRFYLVENKILCEYDFEERMVFANLSRQQNLDLIRTQQQQQTNRFLNNNNNMIGNNNLNGHNHHINFLNHGTNGMHNGKNHHQQQLSPTSTPFASSIPTPTSMSYNNHTLSNNANNSNNLHHNHNLQQLPQHHLQQPQQFSSNKDGELCDASSSGYGSGDSPFDR